MSEPLRESVIAARCLLRRLPLFFRTTPKTPLRVLGIVAFDTLHVFRTSHPLPKQRVAELATFLDFEGCANAQWDHKDVCESECRLIRQRLENDGLGPSIEAYCRRLASLESARPSPGGDHRRFADVRDYRQAVARLSLTTAAGIVQQPVDANVDILCSILMQCQIVDDVLDYDEDASAGLPSFLTASTSLPEALVWTAEAARSYGTDSDDRHGSVLFPFRVALRLFTMVAKVVIYISRSAHQTVKTHAPQRP
jgi:hypothetical protein